MPSPKVAIQGIQSSFHEIAAKQYFGNNVKTIECNTFKNLFESLNSDKSDYAIMAIENTLAGSILQNYALLLDYGFTIIGETYLQIKLNLLALPGVKLEDLEFIHSHPIALRQCSEYLWSLKNVELVDKLDTADSARQIANNKLKNTAAVANEASAKLFGLDVLQHQIQTHKQNYTRFLVLSKSPSNSPKRNKASICFQLEHRAGSLAKALNIFTNNNINLTKIQSIPIIGKPYEYSFHIDLEWNNRTKYQQAICQIKQETSSFIVLGEYEKGKFELLK